MPGPLTAEDRLAIMDVCARYSWGRDGGDVDLFLSVFTLDARFGPGEGDAGHDAIRQGQARFQGDSAFAGGQHHMAQYRIEGDSERAEVWAYVARLHRIPGTTNSGIIWQGYTTDTLVKRAGRWDIQVRRIHNADELQARHFADEPRSDDPPRLYDPGA